MLKKISFLCFGLLVMQFSVAHCMADVVVYDNGAGGAAGINSGMVSDEDFPNRLADDATLSSTWTITGVQWTGVYSPDNTPPVRDAFTIAFYADASGSPAGGAPLASFNVGNNVNRVDSGFDFSFGSGFDIFEYSAAVNFTMVGETPYWVSIFNNTPGENDDFVWGNMLGGNFNTHLSADAGNTWTPGFNRQDFRLVAAVPEPSSLVMLMIGSIVLFRRRVRRLIHRLPKTI